MNIRILLTAAWIFVSFPDILAQFGNKTEIEDELDEISWELYKDIFNKVYKNAADEAEHEAAFLSNLEAVKLHNLDFNEGKFSFRKQLNKFADIDAEEFRKRNGFRAPPLGFFDGVDKFVAEANKSLPQSLDYRASRAVSPVKNQGACGCCWAFTATATLESQILLSNRPQLTLSEQNLASCDTNGNNQGCSGGMYTNAWDYIIQVSRGIMSDSTYPYTSGNGRVGSCQFNSGRIALTMSAYRLVGGDETSMMTALVNSGPLAVAMDAGNLQLASANQVYSCSGRVKLDHAVTVVGYGTNNGIGYWIIKNSWGSNWGDRGFFYLARGSGDCGVSQYPAFPLL